MLNGNERGQTMMTKLPLVQAAGFSPRRVVAVASFAAFALLPFKPTSVLASARKCVGIGVTSPQVCVDVFGEGGLIREVGANRKMTLILRNVEFCNYYAKWEFYAPNGALVDTKKGPTQRGCTYAPIAYFKVNIPNKNLGVGGKVCVRWYEGGNQIGGSPCITLG
jgi:hypothetical protein